MVLATAKIEDFDRFWSTFSTKGAEKRKQHGCKGSHVFQDPNESDRVWAIFDWDQAGWQSLVSEPRSRRSLGKPGLRKVRPARPSSSASTTPSPRPESALKGAGGGRAFVQLAWPSASDSIRPRRASKSRSSSSMLESVRDRPPRRSSRSSPCRGRSAGAFQRLQHPACGRGDERSAPGLNGEMSIS